VTARHRRPAALALAALVLACPLPLARLGAQSRSDGPHADRESVVLSAWKPPAGQKCEVSNAPRVLPEPAALVDTADLSLYLEQSGATRQRGYVLISLKFDSVGAARRVRVLESDLPDTLAGQVNLAVLTVVRPQPAGAPFGVRLRIDFTPEPALRVGRSERCEPAQVRSRSGYTHAAPPGASMMDEQISSRWYDMRWSVLVGSDGRVMDAELLTPIDDQELATGYRDYLLWQRWYPGLDDRVPTQMSTVVAERLKMTVLVRRWQ
jgi:hypothetical protein